MDTEKKQPWEKNKSVNWYVERQNIGDHDANVFQKHWSTPTQGLCEELFIFISDFFFYGKQNFYNSLKSTQNLLMMHDALHTTKVSDETYFAVMNIQPDVCTEKGSSPPGVWRQEGFSHHSWIRSSSLPQSQLDVKGAAKDLRGTRWFELAPWWKLSSRIVFKISRWSEHFWSIYWTLNHIV